MKVVRWLVVVKSIRREMYQAAHPETVQPVRLGGHVILEGISASLATLGNIGPGLGRLGPSGNYEFFSVPSKFLMIVLMWVGRLEIVPVLALFVSGLRESG